MPRSPVNGVFEEETDTVVEDEGSKIDATMLPPG